MQANVISFPSVQHSVQHFISVTANRKFKVLLSPSTFILELAPSHNFYIWWFEWSVESELLQVLQQLLVEPWQQLCRLCDCVCSFLKKSSQLLSIVTHDRKTSASNYGTIVMYNMAVVSHRGFVGKVVEPPTEAQLWWLSLFLRKNFVMIAKQYWRTKCLNCCRSCLKVLFICPKFQFLGLYSQNLREHRSHPKRHILAWNNVFWISKVCIVLKRLHVQLQRFHYVPAPRLFCSEMTTGSYPL